MSLIKVDVGASSEDYPQKCNSLVRLIGRVFMLLAGWKVEGRIPSRNKVIIIAAPHTTNWDFVYLLGAAFQLGLSVKWLGKKSLFSFPFSWFMKRLGGVAVDRGKSSGMVDQVSEAILCASKISLVVPPSGTRGRTDYWKSGFYHIAKSANVPLICGYLDYEKKIAGLGPCFLVSNSVKDDMNKLRDFYKNKVGKYPELTSVIRLKEEAE